MIAVLTVPDATVVVAIIGVVLGPWVASRLASRRVARKVDATVGVPNGNGNVTEMLTRALEGQALAAFRQAELATMIADHHQAAIVARDAGREEVRQLATDEAERWRLHDLDSQAYRAGQASVHAALLAEHLAQHHHPAIDTGGH